MDFYKHVHVETKEITNNLSNNIRLRWIAICGILITSLFAYFVLSIKFSWLPIIFSNLLLCIFNIYSWKRCKTNKDIHAVSYYIKHAIIQNIFDVIILTVLLYYTGCITNPFQYFYIFHIIGAGILLGKYISYYQALLNIILFDTISLLVYFQIIPYYPLEGFSQPLSAFTFYSYLSWMIVFAVTMLISAYLVEMVMNIIKNKQNEIISRSEQLIEEQNRRKKLLEIVVHELKSPLSTSQMVLDFITDGNLGEISQDVKHRLNNLSLRLRDLQEMVKNILTLKKLEFEDNNFEVINFRELIEDVVNELSIQASSKNITYSTNLYKSDILVYGEPLQLRQVAENIISNAIRYTLNNGTIDIHLEVRGNLCLFSVKDSGIGIPKDEQNMIFTEFYRAKNAIGMTDSGTGLGMSISKSIIEKHHGSITLDSKENVGTFVTVKLPLYL